MHALAYLSLFSIVAVLPSFAVGDETHQTYQRDRNNPPNNSWGNWQPPHHKPEYHRPARPVVQAPSIESGSFQRPYPFHLDYYKMRWGGSYEPYFGNLYGPPNIIVTPSFVAPNPFFGNQFQNQFSVPFGNQFNNQFQNQFGNQFNQFGQ